MKKSSQYILLCCALSWFSAGIAILAGIRASSGFAYTLFASFYMLLPATSSLILQKIHKEKLFSNLGISFRFNRWFVIAAAVPILYAFLTLGVNVLFPNVSFSATYEGVLATMPAEQAAAMQAALSKFHPLVFLLIQLIQAIIAGYTINAVFAFGEELGWRGYLFNALKGRRFLSVSLITGFVWGLWHFPLILVGHNYPQHPILGVGMMIIWCILLSPVMTYIMIKSKSLLTAAFFHGTLNAVAGISTLYLVGGNDLTNGVTALSGFITLLIINVLFFLYDRFVSRERIFSRNVGEEHTDPAD